MNIRCVKCKEERELSEIIELTCNHSFCWRCIEEYLKKNLNSNVKCPEANCEKLLNDVEKRKILSDDDIIKYNNSCLAETSIMHKCLLPRCEGIFSCTTPDTQYDCPICTLFNCVSCQACHAHYSCEGFRLLSPQMKTKLCKEESARAEKIYQEKRKEIMRAEIFSSLQIDSLPNDRIFECPLCMFYIAKGAGVRLKNCGHEICRPCLVDVALTRVPTPCPMCDELVGDEEIQSVLSREELLQYRGVVERLVQGKLDHHFCCQARDCGTLHHTAATTTTFTCTKCGAVNCVPCEAVHTDENETCQHYKMKNAVDRTEQYLQEQIRKGDIWPCIVCKNYLSKTDRCNLIRCPSCKTELCWINRMLRWGPRGRGDTSGGCRCMVNDKPCHPSCVGCAPD